MTNITVGLFGTCGTSTWRKQFFVILIDSQVSESLTNPQLVKASNSARALVLAHIKELNFDNVHLVETLPNMLQLSKKLYQIEQLKTELSQFELNDTSLKGRHV